MSKVSTTVSQGGADTFKAVLVETGLTVDGKAGWQINAIEAMWLDGLAVAAADWIISATCSTIATATAFGDTDEIARVSWGMQNTAGVAVAVGFEPIKTLVLLEPRVTVQPQIYLQCQSTTTGNTNDLIVTVYYEIVKLSDLEVLRLYAGGA